MATTCEENEVELSLGLSIGGCFRKPKKPATIVEKSGENDTDIRSSLSPISIGFIALGEAKGLCGEEDLDPQQRREIHALRRQAARRKREEKQQKRGIVRGRNGGYVNSCVPGRTGSMDEKMMLEALEFQSRVRDREAMENETSGSEPICKKVKSENGGSGSTGVTDDDQEDKSQILEQNQSPNPNRFPYASAPFPVVPMQYPFPHLQYVPFGNGFTFPYGMPYWASPAVAVGDDKSAFKPIACQARRPYQTPSSNGNHKSSASCDSEQNGSKGCGIKQAQSSTCSSASPGSSSSGVSDYHRTSQQGGSSSDTRSFSSGSPSEIPQLHTSFVHNAQGQSELSASSHPVESTQDIEEATHYVGKVVSSNTSQPSPRKTEENPISTTESFPNDKPITTTDNPPPLLPHPSKEAKEDSTKPPRPPQPPQPPALPQMPCVSTTGNGPNGKTINGFLYRYNKTEVSIMCVCHGSSFSPAEFVKHAGGTDVSHPLRKIVVVPSAF